MGVHEGRGQLNKAIKELTILLRNAKIEPGPAAVA